MRPAQTGSASTIYDLLGPGSSCLSLCFHEVPRWNCLFFRDDPSLHFLRRPYEHRQIIIIVEHRMKKGITFLVVLQQF